MVRRGAGVGFSPYPADAEWQLILARRTICALKQELECAAAKGRALERQLQVQEQQLQVQEQQLQVQEQQLTAVTADLRLLSDSVVYTASNATLKSLTII
jgi:hypothetical protein